jgi:tetratricopeptide (TPR) repeat protein
VDVALRLQSKNGKWQVLLGGYHALVAPLTDQDLNAIPEAPTTWRELLARLGPRNGRRLDERMMRQIGELIRSRLITGRIAEAVRIHEDAARKSGESLRLVMHVLEEEEDWLLCRLPLELLHEQTFWFRRANTIGVRLPDVPDEGTVDFGANPRAVIAWASQPGEAPSDDDLRKHSEAVRDALKQAGFSISIVEVCKADELQRAVEAGCELLYIVCHGLEDPDSRGQLQLADRHVTGTTLGEWIYNAGAHGRRVQAVFLNACSSAALDRAGSSGMAQHLAGGKLAMAAVGYRAPVYIAEALPFVEAVAKQLSERVPFEVAVCRARSAMPAETPDWVLPILYARERGPLLAISRSIGDLEPRAPSASLLPPAPRPYFMAREAELTELRRQLSTPSVQLLTAGEGGIGKTEIARALAHEAAREGRLVMWLERADLAPVGALATMVKHANPGFEVLPGTSAEDLRVTMRQILGGQRGLLVLDDLASDDCVTDLTPGGQWSVLATSRDASLLPGAPRLTVAPFDLAASTRLLSRLVYEQDELPAEDADAANALLELLAGVPLLIDTTAALLRQGYEYEELTANLQQGVGDVHAKATALLQRSLATLNEKDRFAWYVVSALPTAGASAQNLAVALDEHLSVADRRLRRLRDRSLVRQADESARATLHPLARQIAREHALNLGLWDRVRDAASTSILHEMEWCMEPLDSNSQEATRRWRGLREFMSSIPLAEWSMGVPGADRIAASLLLADNFRQIELPLQSRSDLLEQAKTRASTHQTQAWFHRINGTLRRIAGDLAGAIEEDDRAVALAIASRSPQTKANVHYQRGTTRLQRDELLEAASDYKQAIEIYTRLSENRLGLANTLLARGKLRARVNDVAGAESDYEQSLRLHGEIQDHLGIANVLQSRADMRVEHDDLERAEADYQRAWSLYQADTNKRGLGNTHKGLGALSAKRGRFREAEAHYGKALELFEQVEDKIGQANTYNARGELAQQVGKAELAESEYLKAIALYRAIGMPFGESIAQTNLVSTALARGDLSSAKKILAEASAMARAETDDPVRQKIVRLERLIAEASSSE